MKGELLMNDHD